MTLVLLLPLPLFVAVTEEVGPVPLETLGFATAVLLGVAGILVVVVVVVVW